VRPGAGLSSAAFPFCRPLCRSLGILETAALGIVETAATQRATERERARDAVVVAVMVTVVMVMVVTVPTQAAGEPANARRRRPVHSHEWHLSA